MQNDSKDKQKSLQSSDDQQLSDQPVKNKLNEINTLIKIFNPSTPNQPPQYSVYVLTRQKTSIKKTSPHFIQLYQQFFTQIYQNPATLLFADFIKSYSNILNQHGIKFNQQNKINIKKKYASNCHKIITFQVQVSLFIIQVQIFNIDGQDFDLFIEENADLLGNGSQGKVYKIPFLPGIMKRVTCFHPNPGSFKSSIFNTIVQYAITKLLSIFGICPKVIQPFMYDIICTQTSAYFFVQQCQKISQYLQKFNIQEDNLERQFAKIKKDLQKSLYKMHKLQIIHYDIKPQNVMYSPSYKKFVLIDFGMTQSKLFTQGFMEMQSFKGTYFYCSEQMKLTFIQGRREVDVYWNDCFCLSKTLDIIRKNMFQNKIFISLVNFQQYHAHQDMFGQHNDQEYFPIESALKQNSFMYEGVSFESLVDKNQVQEKIKPFINLVVFSYLLQHKYEKAYQNFITQNLGKIEQNPFSYLSLFFQMGQQSIKSVIFSDFHYRFLSLQERQKHQDKSKPQIILQKDKKLHKTSSDKKAIEQISDQLNEIVKSYPLLKKHVQKYLKNFLTKIKSLKKRFNVENIGDPFIFRRYIIQTKCGLYYLGSIKGSQTIAYSVIQRYYLLYDYVNLLFQFFVETQNREKDNESKKDFFKTVEQMFEKLADFFPIFLNTLQAIKSDQNQQSKIKVISDIFCQVCEILCNQVQFDRYIRIIAIEKYFIQVLPLLKMLLLKFQKQDLVSQVEKVEQFRSQKILFKKQSVLCRHVQSFSNTNDLREINNGAINECQYLIVAVTYQFQYLFYTYLMKLIEKLLEKNKRQTFVVISQISTFTSKYEQQSKKLNQAISKLKYQENKQKLDNLSDLKLFIMCSLNEIDQNQQFSDNILFLQKFKHLVCLHFGQSQYSPKQEIQNQQTQQQAIKQSQNIVIDNNEQQKLHKIKQKTIQLEQYMNFLSKKYSKKYSIGQSQWQLLIRQLLFQFIYQQYQKQGYIFKSMAMLETHASVHKQMYLQHQDMCWNVLVGHYHTLVGLYSTLGYDHKVKQCLRSISVLETKNMEKFSSIGRQHCQQILTNIKSKGRNLGYNNVIDQHEQNKQNHNVLLNKDMSQTQLVGTIQEWLQKQMFLQKVLFNPQGISICLSLIKRYVQSKEAQKLLDLLFLISKQLQKHDGGGTLAIKKFHSIYVLETVRLLSENERENSTPQVVIPQSQSDNQSPLKQFVLLLSCRILKTTKSVDIEGQQGQKQRQNSYRENQKQYSTKNITYHQIILVWTVMNAVVKSYAIAKKQQKHCTYYQICQTFVIVYKLWRYVCLKCLITTINSQSLVGQIDHFNLNEQKSKLNYQRFKQKQQTELITHEINKIKSDQLYNPKKNINLPIFLKQVVSNTQSQYFALIMHVFQYLFNFLSGSYVVNENEDKGEEKDFLHEISDILLLKQTNTIQLFQQVKFKLLTKIRYYTIRKLSDKIKKQANMKQSRTKYANYQQDLYFLLQKFIQSTQQTKQFTKSTKSKLINIIKSKLNKIKINIKN